MEKGRNAFKILTGKPTGKRPLGSLESSSTADEGRSAG
jgi:hypothetical protein